MQLVNVRALSRGKFLRVVNSDGDPVELSTGSNTTVDLDLPSNRQALAHHSAIGQYVAFSGGGSTALAVLDGGPFLDSNGMAVIDQSNVISDDIGLTFASGHVVVPSGTFLALVEASLGLSTNPGDTDEYMQNINLDSGVGSLGGASVIGSISAMAQIPNLGLSGILENDVLILNALLVDVTTDTVVDPTTLTLNFQMKILRLS